MGDEPAIIPKKLPCSGMGQGNKRDIGDKITEG